MVLEVSGYVCSFRNRGREILFGMKILGLGNKDVCGVESVVCMIGSG